MTYEERSAGGAHKVSDVEGTRPDAHQGPGPHLMSAATLIGDDVCSTDGEKLGDVKEIMVDMLSGRVSYAVLAFGGFLTMGEKLFAVPWGALRLDAKNKRFTLNVGKEALESAPGFDKANWPDMADPVWEKGIHAFYGTQAHSRTTST